MTEQTQGSFEQRLSKLNTFLIMRCNERAATLEEMNTTAALRNEVIYQSRQLEQQRPLYELRTSEKDLLQVARNIIELLDRKDTENSSH